MSSPIRLQTPAPNSKQKETANDIVNGFALSYLRLCRGQAKRFLQTREPKPGDWVLGADIPESMQLMGIEPRPLEKDEVLVPRLDHLMALLRSEAHAVVLDVYPDDFGCMAFDEQSYSLANIVSQNAEEAALRALLFIMAERIANEPAE